VSVIGIDDGRDDMSPPWPVVPIVVYFRKVQQLFAFIIISLLTIGRDIINGDMINGTLTIYIKYYVIWQHSTMTVTIMNS